MRRSKRISKERTSLADSSTPVEVRPTQKTSNTKDIIQEREPHPVLEKIVTATATSTSERGIYNESSESSHDGDILDLKGKNCFLQQ